MAAVAKVGQYEAPQKRDEMTAWIGMVLFLASWCMMFGALFFSYAALRTRAVAWPPAGLPLIPLTLPIINTLVIAASSTSMQLGIKSIREGKTDRTPVLFLLTLTLGTVFVILQGAVWNDLALRVADDGS